MLAGGALLGRAIRTDGRRRVTSALAGLALVGYGVRERLSGDDRGDGLGSNDHDRPDDRTGETDEAGGPTETMRHESHTGTNPRDVTQDPDVEAETGSDDGSVQFTADQDDEPRESPQLDQDEEGDPRRDDAAADTKPDEDDAVTVDISEAAMADEPNEAVGPDTTQAYPSQVDDTEPDPSPDADAAGGPADAQTDDGSAEDRDEGEHGEDARGDDTDDRDAS